LPHERPHDESLVTPLEGQFWRRVPCDEQTTLDKTTGLKRPIGAVFDDWRDALGELDPPSFYIATECKKPEIALAGHEGYGLIMVTNDLVAECNLKIERREMPGPPGHVVLIGPKTKGVRRKLAKKCVWIVPCP